VHVSKLEASVAAISEAPLVGGRFEILERVGSGGAGNVFRALDHGSADEAAVKVAHDLTMKEPELRRRFVQEAELLESFDHPGILRLRAWSGPDASRPWMATDFCARGSLIDLLRREGDIPAVEVVEWSLQLLDALGEMHARGMVHRDVKPENVLIDADNCAVLADFGVARAPTSVATMMGDHFGTPAYMAPEQAEDVTTAEPRSDLYAVGAMIYSMLTDKPCVGLVTQRKASLARLPEALRPVVDRATRVKVSQRYPTAGDMAAELADALEGMERR
jgi:serine/threonine protein kinase